MTPKIEGGESGTATGCKWFMRTEFSDAGIGDLSDHTIIHVRKKKRLFNPEIQFIKPELGDLH